GYEPGELPLLHAAPWASRSLAMVGDHQKERPVNLIVAPPSRAESSPARRPALLGRAFLPRMNSITLVAYSGPAPAQAWPTRQHMEGQSWRALPPTASGNRPQKRNGSGPRGSGK